MTTVFTLSGAFNLQQDKVDEVLRGEVTAGHDVVPIKYQSITIPDTKDFMAAVVMLNDALVSTTGEKIVLAHSLGSVISSRWLADYGPTSEVDPAELSFVLTANSVHRYGGALRAVWPKNVSPKDTPYRVLEITRQYDGWSDFPQDVTNMAAVSNALKGSSVVHDCRTVSVNEPGAVDFVEGNFTYRIIPTYPIPSAVEPGTAPKWNPWAKPKPSIEEQDATQRPIIEAGYSRPQIL